MIAILSSPEFAFFYGAFAGFVVGGVAALRLARVL